MYLPIYMHFMQIKDGQCLLEVLSSMIDNLKENGLEIKEILADTVYSSKNDRYAYPQKKPQLVMGPARE